MVIETVDVVSTERIILRAKRVEKDKCLAQKSTSQANFMSKILKDVERRSVTFKSKLMI